MSPYARIFTAVAPFVTAILVRFIYGRNKLTKVLLGGSIMWFSINVILAPYSQGMQGDLAWLREMFR